MTFPTVAAGATAAGTFGTPGTAMTSPQIATTFHPRREPQLAHRNTIEVTGSGRIAGLFYVDSPCCEGSTRANARRMPCC
jgi:hypothetical protein